MKLFDLAGKVAIVTGAASGIGRAIARRFAEESAIIIIADTAKNPREGGEPTEALITAAGGRAEAIETDVANWPAVDQLVSEVVKRHGRLDIMVNNAAISTGKMLLEEDEDGWDRVMAVNIKSMFLTSKEVVPVMLDQGAGAIVNIASVQCLRGDPKPQDAYQASKAGVIALTKSIAVQYAPVCIRANCVLPGGAWTPLQERWDRDPEAARRAAEAVPLGRVGRAEDIANAIVFLLSDKASWITGTELIVDGGVTALP